VVLLVFLFVIVVTSCSSQSSYDLAQDAKYSGTLYGYKITISDKVYRIVGFGQTNKDGSLVIHDINDKVWTFPAKVKVERQEVTYEFFVKRTKVEDDNIKTNN
jgi:hypothetical protein